MKHTEKYMRLRARSNRSLFTEWAFKALDSGNIKRAIMLFKMVGLINHAKALAAYNTK